MGCSRYAITEPDKPHFLTCTVVEWLAVFTRPEAVAIVLDSWRHLREHEGLKLYGCVIVETHLHFVAQAPRLDKCVAAFKSFTAARLIDLLERHRAERILVRLRFAKKAHNRDRQYQFSQEGAHAEMVFSDAVMRQKLAYIHDNAVKRSHIDRAEHWYYSSARNYAGETGLIEIDCWH